MVIWDVARSAPFAAKLEEDYTALGDLLRPLAIDTKGNAADEISNVINTK